MSEKHPLLSIISTSAAFSLATFGALQYVQVTPLESEVAKLKEQLTNQKAQVFVSKEYQELNNNLSLETARREYLEAELEIKVGLESKIARQEIVIKNQKESLDELKKYSNYNELLKSLTKSQSEIESYKKKTSQLQASNEKLKGLVTLRSDLDSLYKQRTKLEEIIACMNDSCQNFYYSAYAEKDFNQAEYEQYNSQLDTINKEITLIMSKLPAI